MRQLTTPTRSPSPRHRRRRGLAVVGILVAVAVVAFVVSLDLSGRSPQTTTPPSTTTAPGTSSTSPSSSSTSTSSTTTTTTTGPSPPNNLPVSTATYTFVDTTRPTEENGQVLSPSRTLRTDVVMPSSGGPYPLVVFASGWMVGPPTYERFLKMLASSGYIVAAPSFPLQDPATGLPLDENDVVNEPGDVSFVITKMLQGKLKGRIDASDVAVVGHSDGADVALMVGYEQGTVDPRVKAVVADAPDSIGWPLVPSSSTPLLLMQGTADTVVPYQASQDDFQQIPAPRYYLSLIGADHLPPIQGPSPWTQTLDTAVVDFLNATVAHRGPGTGALAQELNGLPNSSLQTAG